MTDEELEQLLAEWGALSKYSAEKREGPPDSHVLQRGRQFAPGTRARAAARLVGRDGHDRRRYMALVSGIAQHCGVQIVPASFVDPVPSQETRSFAPMTAAAHSAPPHLRVVEHAALELYRLDVLKGLCLRQEYCGYGPQSDKAAKVAHAVGAQVGLRVYREQLAHAKGWMHGRLAHR